MTAEEERKVIKYVVTVLFPLLGLFLIVRSVNNNRKKAH